MSGMKRMAVVSPLCTAFDQSASPSAKKPDRRQRVKPLSVRLSAEERAVIEKAAASSPSMNAYLRAILIGAGKPPKVKTRSKAPVKDFEALARVLGALGRSGIPDALGRLVAAQERANAKSADGMLTPRTASAAVVDYALVQACADIAAMRRDLVAALGLKPV